MPETQQSVSSWAEEIFGPVNDPAALVKRAALELDELLDAVEAQDKDEIAKEAADIVILLMRLLEQHGLELSQAVDAKMVINRTRQWKSKGDGTGSHIKD
jgi:NTP pyrophosphatase (non-canonical NTP hydrolase)